MRFYATIYEKGKREVNQDSIALHKVHTRKGEAILAIVCDGLGGMDCGEIASGYVVQEMSSWFYQEFANKFTKNITKKVIKQMVLRKLFSIHEQLVEYGIQKQIHCGTTVLLLLTWDRHYMVLSVGDSIGYMVEKKVKELTSAQNQGNRLLACIGIGRFPIPQFSYGKLHSKQVFLLMTDGITHRITKEDILRMFSPYTVNEESEVVHRLDSLVRQLLLRGESDNMSAIYLNY